MKKKNFQRKLKRLLSSVWVNLILDSLLALIFFVIAISLSSDDGSNDIITGIFSNGVAISVVLIDAILILLTKLVHLLDTHLEESEKISDDAHKILSSYKDYETSLSLVANENYFSDTGHPLELHQTFDCSNSYDQIMEEHLKLHSKKHLDIASDEYKQIEKSVSKCKNEHTLQLPDINIFTNTGDDLQILFEDSNVAFEIPEFIVAHTPQIMAAHKTSSSENTATIRLDNASYDRVHKRLVLNTSRTCYYHMLLTNRAMDFELGQGVTIRQLFEYRRKLFPLNQTKMANQIGVEGLIFTTDGQMLIEKRSHKKKTTWRDKFAQPISLSLKKNDLGLTGDGCIRNDRESAEKCLSRMIQKHLKDSFGLEKDTNYDFSASKNLLGISRDLMEGGKPNLYFYVVFKGSADELKATLERERNERDITKEKLYRKLYLYKGNDIKIDYEYRMHMNLSNAQRVYPRKHYTESKENVFQNIYIARTKCKMAFRRTFRKHYVKECGESFLGCLAYYELCKEKIEHDIQVLNIRKQTQEGENS